MATVYPFRALRPDPSLAEAVAAVPYDVVSSAEARELAAGNSHSFLHVTKPEIDLGTDIDPYSDAVYDHGGRALRKMMDSGVLVQEEQPCFYAYALTMDGKTQTGVVLCASVAEYDQNLVRKHEYTRPDKENDRVRHMEAMNAQSGTVFLAHRDNDTIAKALEDVCAGPAEVDFTAADGIRHRFWVIGRQRHIDAIERGFSEAGPIYIADGHHRSAAASRVAAARRNDEPDGPHERFLAVSFPVSEVNILPYNRVVKDLGELTESDFLAAAGERFELTEGKPDSLAPKQFGMYRSGRWYTLTTRDGSYDPEDPVGRLDVSILQDQLLAPVLGIGDPRRDKRIDFVGGIRGPAELEKRTREGWAVAFELHATSMAELLAIADAEQVMPPKSTWFEPKLRDGLFVHLL